MITSGGTATLGLYDNASAIKKKADITYVDSMVASIAGGHKGYATLALATTASTGLSANTVVEVTNDATTSNNGLYLWNGTTLTKSNYDPLSLAKAYTDTTIKSKSLGTTDLNTLFTEGVYFQSTSANATSVRNYPLHAQATNSTLQVIAMSSNTIMQVIYAAGKTSTRMIFSASATPTYQVWNTSLNTADKTSIDSSIATVSSNITKRLEWYVSGSNGVVSYNPSTKTLSWNNVLVAASAYTTRRVQLPSTSFTFSGTAYETLYLDLANVPSNGTVTIDDIPNCLKIAKYGDPVATAFTDKSTQIPLAKMTPQGNLVGCSGFPTIIYGSEIKDTFTYNKISDRITFYHQATNGNLIKYLLRHDVYPFDGVTSRSQTDMWRLERAIEVDQTLTETQEIVTYGEWEFAMRETAYPDDHVGGVHGDEVLTSALFIVDGVYKDPLTWVGSGEAKEIRLQLKSNIYRLNTSTVIAEHYKELVITKNSVVANQWVKNISEIVVDRYWMAMLPTNRVASNLVQVSKNDIREGIVRDVTSSGFTQIYTPLIGVDFVNVSGDKYSTSVKVSNIVGALETSDIYVSNDAAYNKIYVSAIGGSSSGVTLPVNTKISWTTEYRVNATS